MSDYIKREDAIKIINSGISTDTDADRRYVNGLFRAIRPADVAPVRHGRWVTTYRYGFPLWECSECGTLTGTANFPYCYDCGAKMDEEVD